MGWLISAVQGVALLFAVWLVCSGLWALVESLMGDLSRDEDVARFELPPSRLRLEAIPDLAMLRRFKGRAYMVVVTVSGRHQHYAPNGFGNRIGPVLCGLAQPTRRAKRNELDRYPVCKACRDELLAVPHG